MSAPTVLDPPANVPFPIRGRTATPQEITSAFQARWDAEHVAARFVLPANYTAMSKQQQVMTLMNLERTARKLPPLTEDPALLGVLMTNHVAEMDAYHLFDHDSPLTGTFSQRLRANAALGNQLEGEIIHGETDPAAAVFGWMYDDGPGSGNMGTPWGHRHNIVKEVFLYAGIGVGSSGLGVDFAGGYSPGPGTGPPGRPR